MDVTKLWNKLESNFRGYLIRQLDDQSAVDDILQDAFLKMYHKMDTLRDPLKAENWAFQIVRNTLMEHFQKRTKEFQKRQLALSMEIQGSAEDISKTETLASWLPDAIQVLPDKYREAIYLTEIKGLSQKDLAKRLNISYSGAKSRVQRGRELLKKVILDCCEVAADNYGNILDYHSRPQECADC